MRHYLVVANRTLCGEHLVRLVEERIASGPCRFRVIVPATHPWGSWTEGGAHAEAQRRLDDALARFRAVGADVTGEVGDANPVRAVGDALLREPADEILLSTLPIGASRWLGRDVVRRMERTHRLPVVHVVAEPVAV